jgi:hypothetical protein
VRTAQDRHDSALENALAARIRTLILPQPRPTTSRL